MRLLIPPDSRGLLPTPQETGYLNLSAGTILVCLHVVAKFNRLRKTS